MKAFFLALFLSAANIAAADLRPISPERLLEHSAIAAAARDQSQPIVASGPDVSLVAWFDQRRDKENLWHSRAARVSHDGQLLDPLGLELGSGAPVAAFWNGEDFSVIVAATNGGHLITRVDDDGRVVSRRRFEANDAYRFSALSGKDEDTRMLFLAGGATASIFDRFGNLVVGGVGIGLNSLRRMIAAPDDNSDFLILGTPENDVCRWWCEEVHAVRLSRDGAPGLPLPTGAQIYGLENYRLAFGRDGWLLVGPRERTIEALPLRRSGEWTGRREFVDTFPHSAATAAIAWNGDAFELVWHKTDNGDARVMFGVASNDGTVVSREELGRGAGFTNSVALSVAATGERQVAVAAHVLDSSTGLDVYLHRFPSGDVAHDTTLLVTRSELEQQFVEVAAFGSGYALANTERGPDGYEHLYVRFVDRAGTPAGAVHEVAKAVCCNTYGGGVMPIELTVSEDVVLVAWREDYRTFYRRFSSSIGWLDSSPVPLSFGTVVSTREGFVFAGTFETGVFLPAYGSAVSGPSNYFVPEVAAASSGEEILAVWVVGRDSCNITCQTYPHSLVARRFSPTGTPLDAALFPIEDRVGYPSSPAAAWDGSRYVVAWVDGMEIRAASVTRDGAVNDRQPEGAGTILRILDDHYAQLELFRTSSGMALIIGERELSRPSRASVAIIPPGASISNISLTWAGLVDRLVGEGSISGASNGDSSLVAYARLTSEAGGVGRIWTRLFGEPRRNRTVRR